MIDVHDYSFAANTRRKIHIFRSLGVAKIHSEKWLPRCCNSRMCSGYFFPTSNSKSSHLKPLKHVGIFPSDFCMFGTSRFPYPLVMHVEKYFLQTFLKYGSILKLCNSSAIKHFFLLSLPTIKIMWRWFQKCNSIHFCKRSYDKQGA